MLFLYLYTHAKVEKLERCLSVEALRDGHLRTAAPDPHPLSLLVSLSLSITGKLLTPLSQRRVFQLNIFPPHLLSVLIKDSPPLSSLHTHLFFLNYARRIIAPLQRMGRVRNVSS